MYPLAMFLVLTSCTVPDEVGVTYGHSFNRDNEFASTFDLTNEDSDQVGAFVSWRLKPLVTQPIRIVDYLQPQGEPSPITLPPPELPKAGAVKDAVKAFDALDTVTRVCLLVAICWLGWVYRTSLGRLIPGSANRKPKS